MSDGEYKRRPLIADEDGNLLPQIPSGRDEREEEEEEFDPEWFLCQTSVSLVGRLHIKDHLKQGEGPYGKQCFFSLRTKKLKNGKPFTNYFMIKVFGNDMVSIVEKLANGTYIRITGDLERWRDSTYIRARSIVPQLDLERQAEEMMRRHREENEQTPEEGEAEAEMVRDALEGLAEKTRSVVSSARGNGGGRLVDANEKTNDRNEKIPGKTWGELSGEKRVSPPENTRSQPDDEDGEEADERIMSSKEDLAYILNILEEMENDSEPENDEEDRRAPVGSDDDSDEEDDEEKDDILVVDVKNGVKTGSARMTHSEAERYPAEGFASRRNRNGSETDEKNDSDRPSVRERSERAPSAPTRPSPRPREEIERRPTVRERTSRRSSEDRPRRRSAFGE